MAYTKLVTDKDLWGKMKKKKLAKEKKKGYRPGHNFPNHGLDHGPRCCKVLDGGSETPNCEEDFDKPDPRRSV